MGKGPKQFIFPKKAFKWPMGTWEMQSITTVRYQLTSGRMVIIKKTKDTHVRIKDFKIKKKRQKILSACKELEKRELLVGM